MQNLTLLQENQEKHCTQANMKKAVKFVCLDNAGENKKLKE
jgi:hypothetical protein